MTTIEEVGAHLRKLRIAKGISIRKLAERCDVSKTTIVNIEQGLFAPHLDIILRILREVGAELKIEP